MERATIKSLAKALNVSPKTISRALNDEYGVSDALRAKIKQLANEHYYVPNMFGRGLQGQGTKTIGVIVSDNSNPNNSYIIKGIESKAEEHGYQIILCNSNEQLDLEEKKIQLLIQKQVDGIILSPVPNIANIKRTGFEKLQKLKIPYVLTNRYIDGEENNCVKTDNELGGYLATQYLINKGHKNIIYLTTQNEISPSNERLTGFKKALSNNGLTFTNRNVFRAAAISQKGAYDAALEMFRNRSDFTAVFAFNDIMAFGVLKAAYEFRLRVPADIAVIGYDNTIYAEIALVPLTTVHQASYEIGATAMELLLDKLNNRKGEKSILFEPYIVERLSV